MENYYENPHKIEDFLLRNIKMEESEDVTGTRKISSLSLLPNLNSDRHNKNYYDTNQYSQNDGRKINSIELSRQSSTTRHSSSSSNNRICCSNVYCSPEWRRISRKSIIISVFLFFGGLVSITDHLTLVYLLSFSEKMFTIRQYF